LKASVFPPEDLALAAEVFGEAALVEECFFLAAELAVEKKNRLVDEADPPSTTPLARPALGADAAGAGADHLVGAAVSVCTIGRKSRFGKNVL
jgi:hypothetical protein